jgi:hypothetical protein
MSLINLKNKERGLFEERNSVWEDFNRIRNIKIRV